MVTESLTASPLLIPKIIGLVYNVKVCAAEVCGKSRVDEILKGIKFLDAVYPPAPALQLRLE